MNRQCKKQQSLHIDQPISDLHHVPDHSKTPTTLLHLWTTITDVFAERINGCSCSPALMCFKALPFIYTQATVFRGFLS